jgi:hypothetical protein
MDRSTDHLSRISISRSKQALGPGRVWKLSDHSAADQADTKHTPLTDRIARARAGRTAADPAAEMRAVKILREALGSGNGTRT